MPSKEIKDLSLVQLFQSYFNKGELWQHDKEPLQIFVRIIDLLRTPSKTNPFNLTELLYILENNETIKNNFKKFIYFLFSKKSFVELITDTGIISDESFFKEFSRKFYNQFLPYSGEENTVKYILSQAFNNIDDYQSIKLIPYSDLYKLFDLLEVPTIDSKFKEEDSLSQLIISLEILSLRICGKGLEYETLRLTSNKYNSAFLALHDELENLKNYIFSNKSLIEQDHIDYKQLNVILIQCEEQIDFAYKNSKKYGISLALNKNLARMRMQLQRIKDLTTLLTCETAEDGKKNTIDLFLKLIQYNTKRKDLKSFIAETTQLFAYEITSQTAETGKKYISSDWGDYAKMFYKAAGGGVIVGVLCIIKVLISKLDLSEFGLAFMYSMNYSIGFILIYLTGMTLATKQPAMTASAITSYLEYGIKKDEDDNHRYNKFAKYFARLIRTQFVAFLGNVLLAFPVALLGIYLLQEWTGFIIGEPKADYLILGLNPIASLAILHAAIAGVYLFIAGLIAGNRSNRNKYYNLTLRIKNAKWLRRNFGIEKAERVSKFYDKNFPEISSNFWFGVFMGSTASVGMFFGLNLDIRHITFSAGNFALGLWGNNFEASTEAIWWSIIGIIIIGFMNFIISFGLSLFVAFKAKSIPNHELKFLLISIRNHFFKCPLEFIVPPVENKDTENKKEDEKN